MIADARPAGGTERQRGGASRLDVEPGGYAACFRLLTLTSGSGVAALSPDVA